MPSYPRKYSDACPHGKIEVSSTLWPIIVYLLSRAGSYTEQLANINHYIPGIPISTIVSLEYHYRPLYGWNTIVPTIVLLEYHYQPLHRWNTDISHCIAGIPLSTILSLEYHYQPFYRWNTNMVFAIYQILLGWETC